MKRYTDAEIDRAVKRAEALGSARAAAAETGIGVSTILGRARQRRGEVRVHCRLPAELHRRLHELSASTGRSVAELVVEALDQNLERAHG